MIDVDAFRAAAERQEEALAPPATSFTVTFDEAEAATVRRLAAMAGVSPQLIVQRLATGMPFRSASVNFKDGWIYTCPHTGQPLPADMRDSQTYWCSAVLEFLGLPVVTTGDAASAQP